MLTPDKTQRYTTELDFDRYNVVKKYRDYEALVAEVKQALADDNSHPNPAYKDLYYKLGLVALFAQRNHIESKFYLTYFLQSVELGFTQTNTDPQLHFQHAHAMNLLGHAETIVDTYQEAGLFIQSRDILLALRKVETDASILQNIDRELAFSYRYIGLMYHRKSMKTKADADYLEAQTNFSNSAEKYAAFAGTKACIDKAESLHLYGASLAQQADKEKSVELFEESLNQLELARQEEIKYVGQIGAPHFMLYTTLQNLANTKRMLAELIQDSDPARAKRILAEASEHLIEAKEGQNKLFATPTPDYAKTIQFMGEVYLARHEYVQAAEAILEALNIKMELFKNSEHGSVKFTLGTIEKLLAKLLDVFPFDHDDFTTFAVSTNHHKLIEQCLAFFTANNFQFKGKVAEQLETLRWRLGSYLNHISRDGLAALNYHRHLSTAKASNHIAFSFQQILFSSNNTNVLELTPEVNNFLLHAQVSYSEHYQALPLRTKFFTIGNVAIDFLLDARRRALDLSDSTEMNKEFAFADCVQALVHYEFASAYFKEGDELNYQLELEQAASYYRKALNTYETHGLTNCDQYARAKNRYAEILSKQATPKEDPAKVFADLEKYWFDSGRNYLKNPFAARHFYSYAQFLKQKQDYKGCLKKLNFAYTILVETDGANARFTQDVKKQREEIYAKLPLSLQTRFSLHQPRVENEPTKSEIKYISPRLT